VIVAADDGEFFHVKARLLEFLDGGFGFDVGFENRHDGIVLGHNVCSFNFLFCFIADDILGRRLGQCYGVLTPLFASAKGAKVLVTKMFSSDLFLALVWARLKRRTAEANPAWRFMGQRPLFLPARKYV
jgi:hypothetical protein